MKRLVIGLLGLVNVLAAAGLADASSSIVQGIQLDVTANLAPNRLPRETPAPVSVSVQWKIGSTTPESKPPGLKTVKIEINREGKLQASGLPVCPYSKIQPASTARALGNCRSSLVGTGSFTAQVGLEGQESYTSRGRMLVFNGLQGGRPVLYGHIYTSYPFAASFVIVFKVSKSMKGTYGTALTGAMPPNLRAWGNLTEVEMRLSRKYHVKGHAQSFLSGSCQAPTGFTAVLFPLARTTFTFDGGTQIHSTLEETCKVRH